MSSVRSVFIGALVVLLLTDVARAACGETPPVVRNLDLVRGGFLLVRSTRATYLINDHCFDLPRREFNGVLYFSIINRFDSDLEQDTGYLWVRSYRTFTVPQSVKVKVSRGDGWFLPTASSERLVKMQKIVDRPYAGSVQNWNAAHSSPTLPEGMPNRLGLTWHAYAHQEKEHPSTTVIDFWKIDDQFDLTFGSLTNYLLRFNVNTEEKMSLVPFQVYAQAQVETVELTLSSNIESLSGAFKFTLR